MIVALLYWLRYYFLPSLGDTAILAINALMPVVIVLVGIVILLGCVGMKVSQNLGATITNWFFLAIACICKAIAKFFITIAKKLWEYMPKLFKSLRRFLLGKGVSGALSNAIAALTVTLVIVIVI